MRPACSEDAETTTNNSIKTPVQRIVSVDVDQKTVQFTVITSFPTPCYSFDTMDVVFDEDKILASVFAKLTTTDPCITMISEEEVTSEITVEASGQYLLSFWKSESQSVDTLIVIP